MEVIPGMVEDTFGFIIHPIQIKKDVKRKYPLLGTILPEPVINWACQYFPPQYISEVTGIASAETGKEVRGWFVAAPYTPPMMMSLPVEKVYDKIVATAKLAQRHGAKIVGLGAFTSVVGDAGKTIAERLDIPVTTGDSYTVAIAVDALIDAANVMGIKVPQATVAVVGATGAIGKACARMLAEECAKLILVGKRSDATEQVRELCEGQQAQVIATTDLHAIYEADLVLTVTSAVGAIITPQHLKPGSVVLDVARPRDVSAAVARERNDVLVIEGGMVEVPGAQADFHFNFGFPPRMAFACMAETIALSLEGRYENFTIGRDLQIDQIKEIRTICNRHGFKLAGFRAFEHAVTQDTIDAVRERAVANRKVWSPAIG
jgi:predicted amino acid dehydrogenase